jgi:hypothetical protein
MTEYIDRSVIFGLIMSMILFPSFGYLIGISFESDEHSEIDQTYTGETESSECIEKKYEKLDGYDRITYHCKNEIKICDSKSSGYWSCFVFDMTVKYNDTIEPTISDEVDDLSVAPEKPVEVWEEVDIVASNQVPIEGYYNGKCYSNGFEKSCFFFATNANLDKIIKSENNQ